eukprot:677930-Prorocentrum_minimum.AAC.1
MIFLLPRCVSVALSHGAIRHTSLVVDIRPHVESEGPGTSHKLRKKISNKKKKSEKRRKCFGLWVARVLCAQLAVSGRGKYYPKRGTPHVVVCGGAVSSDSAVTLNAFLSEILHPERGAARPEVVLMAPTNPKEWVVQKMRQRQFRGKLRYIRGHPIDYKDAARAKLHAAEMVRHVIHHIIYRLRIT